MSYIAGPEAFNLSILGHRYLQIDSEDLNPLKNASVSSLGIIYHHETIRGGIRNKLDY